MYSEIDAIAEREGLSEPVLAQLRAALDRAVAQERRTFALPTVDLGPVPMRLAESSTDELPPLCGPGDRYIDLGLVATGGMGEVRRVRDRDLGRSMAMKIIKAHLLSRPAVVARFIEEAQCSAQLQHPAIVPVHELGRGADGRYYFTMAEVEGRTLGEVIAEVHVASGERWEPSPSGWTFRRLVDAFLRVCEAVAYAHGRGVLHRDIKPANVMLGAHGEVLLVDWGLAKVLGRPDRAAEAGELDPVMTDRSQDDSQATQMGQVAGTPSYMAPEQARGEIDAIDARSDIYALGAMLYELLSGHPPYLGTTAKAVLQQVLSGPPDELGQKRNDRNTLGFWVMDDAEPGLDLSGPPLPDELVTACQRAMARAPEDRFQRAELLAADVRSWLDGARRREQALAVVDQALSLQPKAEALRSQAKTLRDQAAELLDGVPSWASEERKAPGWTHEDHAAEVERQAGGLMLRLEHGLEAALRIDATLSEAHVGLAERYLEIHARAEALRDRDAIIRAELALSEHAAALPETHPVHRRCAAYLKGDGALSLVTDPPGAQVLLHRFERHNRRFVPVFQRNLGPTPLVEHSLPMGSYLCIIRHPDRAETRYPIFIGRGEHWDGVAPSGHTSHPIWLPEVEELGPNDCYVPAGWYWSGGDPDAVGAFPRRRLWCDGMVFRRFPVTNTEYIDFLNDLVQQGQQELALRYAPRERAGTADEQGALIYGFEGGRFYLRPDADGDVWHPDYPVLMVDWPGAMAFAAWQAAGSNLPWRLPAELEWEKAARGVDGRFYPWGDVLDPSWCCMLESHAGRALPAVIDRFPVDSGPYGVRGMAGNVRDWCADPFEADALATMGDRVLPAQGKGDPSASRVYRGGCWIDSAAFARLAFRGSYAPSSRSDFLGFRLSRSIQAKRTGPSLG